MRKKVRRDDWSKMVEDGRIWSNMVKGGPRWSKMVKNGPMIVKECLMIADYS